jgi:hypothetical protein
MRDDQMVLGVDGDLDIIVNIACAFTAVCDRLSIGAGQGNLLVGRREPFDDG